MGLGRHDAMRRGAHAATAMTLVAMLAVTSASATFAQQPLPPQKRPKLKPFVACVTLSDTTLLGRIDTLYAGLASKWLQLGEHWFQAYELPGEPRNPLLPKADRQAAVRGFAWVQFPRCQAAIEPATGAWWVQFTAQRLTFNEGTGWTPPLAAGILAEYVMSSGEGGWSVSDNTQAVSFRQPEDKEWRPTAAELPPRTQHKAITGSKPR